MCQCLALSHSACVHTGALWAWSYCTVCQDSVSYWVSAGTPTCTSCLACMLCCMHVCATKQHQAGSTYASEQADV